MADEQNAPAEADASHASADARRAFVEREAQKAFKDRDAAKQSAREHEANAKAAEARAIAAEGRLSHVQPRIDAITKARIDGMLATHVDPKMHAAARAVLATNNVDGFDVEEADVVTMLRAANLVQTRNGGSPGTPGVNLGIKPPHEQPPVPGQDAVDRVLAIAQHRSDMAKGTTGPSYMRYTPRPPERPVTADDVAAIAKRKSDRAHGRE